MDRQFDRDCFMTDKEDHNDNYPKPPFTLPRDKIKPTRRHRITLGELIALRLILTSVDTNIKAALTAESSSDRREALKIAQTNLNLAMELTKDSVTL